MYYLLRKKLRSNNPLNLKPEYETLSLTSNLKTESHTKLAQLKLYKTPS